MRLVGAVLWICPPGSRRKCCHRSSQKAKAMRTVSVRKRLLPALGGLALLLWLSAVPGWAGFEEGIQAYKQGDYATAARAWLPLAQQGDARAQFLLGSLYAQGYGVPQDYGAAAQWFRRAAEQGHVAAQYNLGVLYANGDGVPRDASQAAQWLRRAADQEDPKAQYNLGLFYAGGVGVPQDYGEAYVWFTLAAARMPSGVAHEQAVRNRDIIAAH